MPTHRGLGCWFVFGRVVAGRAYRPRGLDQELWGRQPSYRRLLDGRGARRSATGRAQLPAAYLDVAQAQRRPVRCGAGRGRFGFGVGADGTRKPVLDATRSVAPLVSLSPPFRGAAAYGITPHRARARPDSAPEGSSLV